jgi:hypothetical protein
MAAETACRARQDRDRRAVGRGAGHGGGRRGAAGAGTRLDHDRLAEAPAEMLGDQARDDVDIRARREPVNHGDGPAALGQRRSRGHRRKSGERRAAGHCRAHGSSPHAGAVSTL